MLIFKNVSEQLGGNQMFHTKTPRRNIAWNLTRHNSKSVRNFWIPRPAKFRLRSVVQFKQFYFSKTEQLSQEMWWKSTCSKFCLQMGAKPFRNMEPWKLKTAGRPSRTSKYVQMVCGMVNRHPRRSVCTSEMGLGIPRSSAHQILPNRIPSFLYRLQLPQELQERDSEALSSIATFCVVISSRIFFPQLDPSFWLMSSPWSKRSKTTQSSNLMLRKSSTAQDTQKQSREGEKIRSQCSSSFNGCSSRYFFYEPIVTGDSNWPYEIIISFQCYRKYNEIWVSKIKELRRTTPGNRTLIGCSGAEFFDWKGYSMKLTSSLSKSPVMWYYLVDICWRWSPPNQLF